MATVEHGGVSVTSNTATEEQLRAELATPPGETPPAEPAAPEPEERARDEKGRFTQKAPAEAPAPADAAAPPQLPLEPEKPAKDPTLPRHNPIARMNKALAEAAALRERNARLEAELQARAQAAPASGVPTPELPPPPRVTAIPEPQFEQFANAPDPYTAYMQAWARWDRAEGIAQARLQWEAEQAQRTQAAAFADKMAAGRKARADFDAVLTEADTMGLQVSAVMQAAIAESDHAADLVYYLATHPEVCTQLAEESIATPVTAGPVMRRLLESHLSGRADASNGAGTAAPTKPSTAKPPIQPVGSSPVVTDEPPGDAATAAEHARYWNRKLKVPGSRL